MSAVAVFFSLLITCAAGYGVVRWISRGLSASESSAWSFAVGILVLAVIELALLAAGLPPGPKKLLAAQAAAVAVSLWLKRPEGIRSPALRPRPPAVAVLLLVLAAAGVLCSFIVALSGPMSTTDYLAIWGLKGRTIFATASIPRRLFHDPALSWSHPEYPLLLPLIFAALAAGARTWDDQALALVFPFFQIATVLALYGFLARRISAPAGAAAAALTALCLPLYGPGSLGLAEIPMALGFVLLSSAVLEALDADSREARARLALASLFCAAVKQEGTLFALLVAAVLVGRRVLRRERGSRFLWLWVATPALLHGVALRLLRGPVTRRAFDLSLVEPHRWTELASRGGQVALRLWTVELPHAAVALAALVLFFFVTQKSFADWLLTPLAAQVALYAALCALSAFGATWMIETSFARIAVTLFPALTLVLGARLAAQERSPGS